MIPEQETKKPFFSIVIPTYNSYEKLLRAVKSIHNQTFLDYEIIIVDDGSTDKTKDLLPAMKLEKVRYFYKINGGPASARNVGISQSLGKYICFLDADDEFMPNKLSRFYENCLRGAVFLFSDAEYYNEKDDTSSVFSSKNHMKYGNSFKSLLEQNFIVASTVCIEKTVLDTTKYFDEALPLKFVEDYDLWLTVANNYQLTYIEEALTKYYIHDSNNSSNVARTYASLKVVYRKWIFSSLIALKNFCKYTTVLYLYQFGIKK